MHTQRLLLRPLALTDAPEIFALRSSAEVNRYLGREPAQHLDDAVAFIQKIQQNVAAGGTAFWAIQEQSTPRLVGTICLFNWDREHGSVEIGYELLPEQWGRGIIAEVLPTVLRHAFEVFDFQSVVAALVPDNLKSVRLLENAGFRLITNELTDDGLVEYVLQRAEFLQKIDR